MEGAAEGEGLGTVAANDEVVVSEGGGEMGFGVERRVRCLL